MYNIYTLTQVPIPTHLLCCIFSIILIFITSFQVPSDVTAINQNVKKQATPASHMLKNVTPNYTRFITANRTKQKNLRMSMAV